MKIVRALVMISTLAMVAINILANALPINGINTGAISDKYPVLFTPAGYVFAIWGVIYLLLLGFSIYQLLPAQQDHRLLSRMAPWVILANVLNSAWIFFWHYELLFFSEVIMIGLLLTLIVIYLQISAANHRPTKAQRWWVQLPMSVYLGWISVATIANTAILLYDLRWNGWGVAPPIWTALLLAIAGALGVIMLWKNGNIAFNLVLVWAFIGIAFKQLDGSALVAFFAAGLAFLLLILGAIRMRAQAGFFPKAI